MYSRMECCIQNASASFGCVSATGNSVLQQLPHLVAQGWRPPWPNQLRYRAVSAVRRVSRWQLFLRRTSGIPRMPRMSYTLQVSEQPGNGHKWAMGQDMAIFMSKWWFTNGRVARVFPSGTSATVGLTSLRRASAEVWVVKRVPVSGPMVWANRTTRSNGFRNKCQMFQCFNGKQVDLFKVRSVWRWHEPCKSTISIGGSHFDQLRLFLPLYPLHPQLMVHF